MAEPGRGGTHRMRVGLIGAGMISLFHTRAWRKAVGAELVAICDPLIDRPVERASEFGVPAVYADMETMADREALDAVDIAASTPLHVELVQRAADRGLAILCQKPLAPTYAEAAALAEAVAGRCRLMVHENWRFRPYYRMASRWLAEGLIGRAQEMRLTATSCGLRPDASGARPALVREPGLATARPLFLGSVLIHHLDVARALLGSLTVLAARIGREVEAVAGETRAAVLLETEKAIPVFVAGNLADPSATPVLQDSLTIVGTEAAIRFAAGRLDLVGLLPRSVAFAHGEAYQAAFDACIAHFTECVLTGAAFETDVADNLETLRLVSDAFRLAKR